MYFEIQLQTLRVIGYEKAAKSGWGSGHFGMSHSSTELECWVSEHWQLLLNNQGCIIYKEKKSTHHVSVLDYVKETL